MIPRVRSALVQFLTPISSSTEGHSLPLFKKEHQEEKNQSFQDSKEKPKPHLTLVPTSPEPLLPDPSTPLLIHPFVQLLGLFQEQKIVLQKWLGVKTYLETIKNQKSSSRSFLGVMLDKKNE